MERKLCGLVGATLKHSYSVPIHEMLGNPEYRLFELSKDELHAFFLRDDILAVNVTIPYKREVLKYCVKLSPEAEAAGAVNTVVRGGGGYYGYNTDLCGFEYMLSRAGIGLSGKKVLVLGSGGASGTVCVSAKRQGAKEVTVISRSGPDNYENLGRHADAEVIINATPVGMYPDVDAAPVSLEGFPRCSAVADLIYNPAETRLMKDAKNRGIRCTGGLPMLVAQAKAAEELFFGKKLPNGLIEEIIVKMEAGLK